MLIRDEADEVRQNADPVAPATKATSQTDASWPAVHDATPGDARDPTDAASRQHLTHARLRRLLSYYRPHLPLLGADLGCAVLVSATALLMPLCANLVTRQLGAADGGMVDDTDAFGPILLTGGAMLILLAVQALAGFFVDFHGHMMGARIEAEVRRELFDHCQRLDFAFHDRTRTGQLMSRITNDSFDLGELFHHGPEDLAIAVLKTFGVLAILIWFDGPLALMVLAVLPVAVLHALRFGGRMNRAHALSNERIAFVNERVEDALGGVRVAQSFGGEALEARRFVAENARFLDSRRAVYRAEAFFSGGLDTFLQLATVLVITAGALRVARGGMDVADLLTFLLCVAVLLDPVHRVANLVRLWQAGYAGYARMAEVLEVEPEVRDRPGAVELARPQGALLGAIAFERVGFRYGEGGRHVLRDLSLTVRPGEFVALVGPSGVGKSTLCALVPRFYDVTEGRVLVDGVDVRDVTLASLRRAVGVVQQDAYLFVGTVADNIRYGRPDATDAEVVAAAQAAAAHEFILALPQGYGSEVGQRGVRLSGGQRQRLTLARAFLKDPPILILDEATSALDVESERRVQAALLTLARGRTTLVIAHRLSTVRLASRIVVLTEDGIAEDGTHDELVARGGVYAGLHAMQGRI